MYELEPCAGRGFVNVLESGEILFFQFSHVQVYIAIVGATLVSMTMSFICR